MAKIKIYTTTTCPYCHQLKEYLKSKNVAYEEVVVDKQPGEEQNLLDTCGSMGVPCSHITKDDGTEVKILGFDKAKVDETLGLT